MLNHAGVMLTRQICRQNNNPLQKALLLKRKEGKREKKELVTWLVEFKPLRTPLTINEDYANSRDEDSRNILGPSVNDGYCRTYTISNHNSLSF